MKKKRTSFVTVLTTILSKNDKDFLGYLDSSTCELNDDISRSFKNRNIDMRQRS